MRQINGSPFDKSPQAFCIVQGNKDRKKSIYEFRFVYFNEAFIRLEGIERKRLAKGSFYQIFPESGERWIDPFYEAAYKETISEIWGIPEGQGRYLSITCFPVRPGYCGCILRDCIDMARLLYGNMFFAHFYVDLEKDWYSCFYLEETLQTNIPDKGCFSELKGLLAKSIVYPDDQEYFCRILKKEYLFDMFRIKGHGKMKNSCYIEFRSMQSGEIKNCRMTLLEGKEEAGGEADCIHMLLQNLDGEIRKKEMDDLECADSVKETVKRPEEKSIKSELDIFMEEDFTGYRILLAEDNDVNREILAEILAATGADVETAENGKEAAEYIRNSPAGHFDMVLMDVNMPLMNGYEATRKIRAMENGNGEQMPIIAMTANAFDGDILAAKEAGMNGHIAKPIDFKELDRVLKKWLKKETTVR